MSNSRARRKPKATGQKVLCPACLGKLRPETPRYQLPDGGEICMRCYSAGVLLYKLPCGHMTMPGMLIIADSADGSNFQCPRCSPHTAEVRGTILKARNSARGRPGAGLQMNGAH